MSKLGKWWKAAAGTAAAVVALQVAVSALVRTGRMHAYLTAHLERAFGRPVQVGSFGAHIFPRLQLYANEVTVGEDPAFGYEYFLRAEHLSAGLRWSGLLRYCRPRYSRCDGARIPSPMSSALCMARITASAVYSTWMPRQKALRRRRMGRVNGLMPSRLVRGGFIAGT